MKDLRGIELKEGDTVLYFQSGRYSSISVATVAEIRKKVKLIDRKMMNRRNMDGDETVWAERSSLVVSNDLPEKEVTV